MYVGGFIDACVYGHLTILKWLDSKCNDYDYHDCSLVATDCGHPEVAKWLASKTKLK